MWTAAESAWLDGDAPALNRALRDESLEADLRELTATLLALAEVLRQRQGAAAEAEYIMLRACADRCIDRIRELTSRRPAPPPGAPSPPHGGRGGSDLHDED